MINFQIGGSNEVFLIWWSAADVIVKNVSEGSRDDPHLSWVVSHTLHGEGLACTRLSVGKDGSVEPLEDGVDKRSEGLFVQLSLITTTLLRHL